MAAKPKPCSIHDESEPINNDENVPGTWNVAHNNADRYTARDFASNQASNYETTQTQHTQASNCAQHYQGSVAPFVKNDIAISMGTQIIQVSNTNAQLNVIITNYYEQPSILWTPPAHPQQIEAKPTSLESTLCDCAKAVTPSEAITTENPGEPCKEHTTQVSAIPFDPVTVAKPVTHDGTYNKNGNIDVTTEKTIEKTTTHQEATKSNVETTSLNTTPVTTSTVREPSNGYTEQILPCSDVDENAIIAVTKPESCSAIGSKATKATSTEAHTYKTTSALNTTGGTTSKKSLETSEKSSNKSTSGYSDQAENHNNILSNSILEQNNQIMEMNKIINVNQTEEHHENLMQNNVKTTSSLNTSTEAISKKSLDTSEKGSNKNTFGYSDRAENDNEILSNLISEQYKQTMEMNQTNNVNQIDKHHENRMRKNVKTTASLNTTGETTSKKSLDISEKSSNKNTFGYSDRAENRNEILSNLISEQYKQTMRMKQTINVNQTDEHHENITQTNVKTTSSSNTTAETTFKILLDSSEKNYKESTSGYVDHAEKHTKILSILTNTHYATSTPSAQLNATTKFTGAVNEGVQRKASQNNSNVSGFTETTVINNTATSNKSQESNSEIINENNVKNGNIPWSLFNEVITRKEDKFGSKNTSSISQSSYSSTNTTSSTSTNMTHTSRTDSHTLTHTFDHLDQKSKTEIVNVPIETTQNYVTSGKCSCGKDDYVSIPESPTAATNRDDSTRRFARHLPMGPLALLGHNGTAFDTEKVAKMHTQQNVKNTAPANLQSTEKPQPIKKPQPTDKPRPMNKPQPTQKPQPTKKQLPTVKEQPTKKPQPTIQAQPKKKPQPVNKPQPTHKPQPTKKPQPTIKAQPTKKPQSTIKAQAMKKPQPTKKPHPTNKPQPTQKLQPTIKARPTKKAQPTIKAHRTKKPHPMIKAQSTKKPQPMIRTQSTSKP